MRLFALLVFVAAACVSCGGTDDVPSIRVSEETLWAAQQEGFEYEAVLASAERGDQGAIVKLIRANEYMDAAASLGHGVVLIELGSIVGDDMFAKVASSLDPSLGRQFLVALEAGAAYTTVPELSLDRFPKTQEALAEPRR